ncbi:MAG: hypothetical protein ACQEWM_10970 [Actinomycetota bacterium]
MPARRARLGLAHALASAGWGAAAALVVQQPLPPSSLASVGAVAAALAAIVLLLPARRGARARSIGGLGVSVLAIAASAALSSAGPLLVPVLIPWLTGGAVLHGRAMLDAAAADPALAPRVRPAPTLLALGVGAAAGGGASALAIPVLAVLLAIAALQLGALVLVIRSPEVAAAPRTTTVAALPARLLPLLGLAVAGATALAVLRPALSSIGVEESQPAIPVALTLLLGGLLGPPLASAISRLGLGRGGAVLATLGGAAALVAPIARPGALDLVVGAVLGVALAAAVALAELARRAGVVIPARGVAVLLAAGAVGGIVATALLTIVPLPDVVLGASIACLVAGLGAWAPVPRQRVAAD